MSLTLHILERIFSFVNEHHFSFLIATFLSLALYFLALRRNLKRKIEELNAKVSAEKTLSTHDGPQRRQVRENGN